MALQVCATPETHFQESWLPQDWESPITLKSWQNTHLPHHIFLVLFLEWNIKFSLKKPHEIEGIISNIFLPFAYRIICKDVKGRKPLSLGNSLVHGIFWQWKRAGVIDSYFRGEKKYMILPTSYVRSWAYHCDLKVQELSDNSLFDYHCSTLWAREVPGMAAVRTCPKVAISEVRN